MFWIGVCVGVVVGFIGFTLMAYKFLGSTEVKTDALSDASDRKHAESMAISTQLLVLHKRNARAFEIMAAWVERREG